MKVITLLNEKGGVGKTTLAVHIATGFAHKGKNVLLIDADAQGHAAVSLGLQETSGLYDLIVRQAPFKDVLKFVSPEVYKNPNITGTGGQLFVIPSNLETRLIPMAVSDAMALRSRLEEVRNVVDLVIIDTSPTPSLLHSMIYLATNAVCFPTKAEWLSFDGLKKSMSHIEAASGTRGQNGLRPIATMGIVPMIFRSNTLEHQENLEELQSAFGDRVWKPVPMSILWSEAARVQRPVWNSAPDSGAAKSAWRLVERAGKELENVEA